MQKKMPLMGLCPIGKFVFSHEDAVRQKRLLMAVLKRQGIKFVDLDKILPDGLVRKQENVDAVVRYFKAQEIDCLFVPHCNFGTEGAVGMIAKKMNVPALLWGPRDEAPLKDGSRLRDTLCGMFASSKVMRKLGVNFTYIENCQMNDRAFIEGVWNFLRAVNMAQCFKKGIRIGQIGQRIDFFWTTIVNESELLEKFNVEVLPIDMMDFITNVRKRVEKNEKKYKEEAILLSKRCLIEGFANAKPLINILAVRDQMLELGEKHGLDGFAVQDFTSLVDAMGTYCFFANSMVSDNYPVACETDIHGAISTILLSRLDFDSQSVFLADVTIRHPKDDNGVLLWHAGAPTSMKHPKVKIRLGTHWILPSPLAGMTHFRLKDGPITILRFDGDTGNYRIAVGEGRSMRGPYTLNNYVWMKTDNWPRWERILMEGPYIHHVAMTYAHLATAAREACKYMGVECDMLNEA